MATDWSSEQFVVDKGQSFAYDQWLDDRSRYEVHRHYPLRHVECEAPTCVVGPPLTLPTRLPRKRWRQRLRNLLNARL